MKNFTILKNYFSNASAQNIKALKNIKKWGKDKKKIAVYIFGGEKGHKNSIVQSMSREQKEL